MNVNIRKVNPDAVLPEYATPGAAGFDLVSIDSILLYPGSTGLIRTGLAFDIPEGYELQIRPRSGVSQKTKLRISNSPGTIDSDYRGEVGILVDNITPPIYENDWQFAMTDVVVSMDGLNDDKTFAKNYSFPSGTHYIPKGTRIAQGVIAPVSRVSFVETDEELTQTERGDGGFGSTGINAEVTE